MEVYRKTGRFDRAEYFVDDLFENESGDQALASYGFSSIESSLKKKKKEREEKQNFSSTLDLIKILDGDMTVTGMETEAVNA